MKYVKILLLSFFVISSFSYAQETEAEAPTNLDKLLELVKEGKSKEQSENKKREADKDAIRMLDPYGDVLLESLQKYRDLGDLVSRDTVKKEKKEYFYIREYIAEIRLAKKMLFLDKIKNKLYRFLDRNSHYIRSLKKEEYISLLQDNFSHDLSEQEKEEILDRILDLRGELKKES